MTQRRHYQCEYPYFVTFNVSYREWLFEEVGMAELLHRLILECGEMKKHLVYQFCIMPDHVHILCQTKPCASEVYGLASRVRGPTMRGGVKISDAPNHANMVNGVGYGKISDNQRLTANHPHPTRAMGNAERGTQIPDVSPRIVGPLTRAAAHHPHPTRATASAAADSGAMGADIPRSQCGSSDPRDPRGEHQLPCACGQKHRYNVSDFIKSIRGTFANKIGRQIWQPRFYDRIIDNEDQLLSTIQYIHNNPITAGLPERYQKYPYQYYNRELADGLFT